MSNSGEVDAQEAHADAAMKEEEKKKQPKPKPKDNKPKSLSHPPYFQMIKEAITALKEKGGSSPYAIAKYMEQKHKAVLPSNFRKILGLQLKNSVSKGKLIKIKASYKLSEAAKRRDTTTSTATTTITKAARANAAKEPTKRRKSKSKSISNIDSPSPPTTTNPTARRSKRSKPKQLKSIKSKSTA